MFSARRCGQGTSLAVQWLRLRASTAGGAGLIPGWGTKIPLAVQPEKKKKEGVRSILKYSSPRPGTRSWLPSTAVNETQAEVPRRHRGQGSSLNGTTREQSQTPNGDIPQNKDPVSPTNDGKKKKKRERGPLWSRGLHTFSVKGQIANLLGFMYKHQQ